MIVKAMKEAMIDGKLAEVAVEVVVIMEEGELVVTTEVTVEIVEEVVGKVEEVVGKVEEVVGKVEEVVGKVEEAAEIVAMVGAVIAEKVSLRVELTAQDGRIPIESGW
jgi:rRNA processing protein Gar1